MKLYAIIEPLYQKSPWCIQYLQGLHYEAGRNAIQLVYCAKPEDIASPEQGMRTCCIFIGSTQAWLSDIALRLKERRIQGISTIQEGLFLAAGTSEISINYSQAMTALQSYFQTYGKNKTALFGVNTHSSTDSIKAAAFSRTFPDGHIFSHTGEIKESCINFLTAHEQFDSVICCSDLVALALLRFLQQQKSIVPQELWLVAFGHSPLADYCTPSITCVRCDYELLGRQMVKLAQLLIKNHSLSTLSGTVQASIESKGTTDNTPVSQRRNDTKPFRRFESGQKFYDDPLFQELSALDRLFSNILPVDFQILQGIYNKKRYIDLAEELHMSENSIKYRTKRMMGLVARTTREELIKLVSLYVNLEGKET
ncbi:substrate-binding domain-containing protein [Sphaerochaeta pleomorpha]|nr:substrate-binding domain-containing protein [Sphaerochaeta pleomorpha]